MIIHEKRYVEKHTGLTYELKHRIL